MGLDDNTQKQLQVVGVISIVLAALALAFGISNFGIWHTIEMDIKMVEEDTVIGFTSRLDIYPDEGEMEIDYDNAWESEVGNSDEKEDIDFSDDEEEIMDNVKFLVYISLASAVGLIVFCNTGDLEKAKIAAVLIALTSFIAGLYFMTEMGEKVVDDYNESFVESSGLENFEMDGFRGDEYSSHDLLGIEVQIDATWGPGIAWYIVTIVIPLLGGFAAYTLNAIESSNTLSYQNEYQSTSRIAQHHQVESTSMPSIPSLQGPIASLESNQIQCPNCKIIVDGNLQNCPNCGFQNR